MSAPTGMFCEHKRLRTSCPTCKPPPPPPPPPRAPKAKAPPAPRAPGEKPPAPPGARGPGKPLLPQRKPRQKGVSADEAAQADAWWVKRK